MPVYSYHCPACEKINIERFVKIDERDKQSCECGNYLSRDLSAPAFGFNGVLGSATMGKFGWAQKLPDVELTTDPK